MNNKYRIKRKVISGLGYFVGFFLVLLTIFPLLITVVSSLKDNGEILLGMFSLPEVWHFDNYVEAVRIGDALTAVGNSLFVASATVIVTVMIAMPAAYILARKNFWFIRPVYLLFMAGVMVPVHCTLISISEVASKMGAKNSYTFLILLYVAFNLSQATFLFTGYIKGIDKGLDEAAKIDGCSDLRVLIQVLLPSCVPIISTEAILVFMYGYSELIFSLVLITDNSKYTVSRGMLNFTFNYTTSYGPQLAYVILSVIPMLIIYLILHEKVEMGIMEGAVKG